MGACPPKKRGPARPASSAGAFLPRGHRHSGVSQGALLPANLNQTRTRRQGRGGRGPMEPKSDHAVTGSQAPSRSPDAGGRTSASRGSTRLAPRPPHGRVQPAPSDRYITQRRLVRDPAVRLPSRTASSLIRGAWSRPPTPSRRPCSTCRFWRWSRIRLHSARP